MLCIEVWVNGNRQCTAGAEDFGRLSANLRYAKWSEETLKELLADWDDEEDDREMFNPIFNVYGTNDKEAHQILTWLEQGQGIGDEITLKIIEAESPDPPQIDEPEQLDTTTATQLKEVNHRQETSRVCIEVWLNGERLCTGGMKDFGHIWASFNWHNVPERGDQWRTNPSLSMSGILEKAPFQSLSWLHKAVNIGDEITLKLIDSENFDEPTVKELLTPDTIDQPIVKQCVADVEERQRRREQNSE